MICINEVFFFFICLCILSLSSHAAAVNRAGGSSLRKHYLFLPATVCLVWRVFLKRFAGFVNTPYTACALSEFKVAHTEVYVRGHMGVPVFFSLFVLGHGIPLSIRCVVEKTRGERARI